MEVKLKRGVVRKLANKEQEEKKCNIAIKEIKWKGDKDIEKGKEWAQKLIKEKIRIDIQVIS